MAVSASTVAAIRWGYGFRPGEEPPASARDLLAQLKGRDAGAAGDFPTVIDVMQVVKARGKATKAEATKSDDGKAMLKAANEALEEARRPMSARRIIAPITSPQGFRERLVSFWTNHFTVASKGPMLRTLAPHHTETAIRPNITGSFADLLIAAETHPGMINYLDQNVSIGPNSRVGKNNKRGLNENLAREILELHTLGAGGGYTQTDVREFAELLTGYTSTPDTGTVFAPERAEPGADRVLGRDYGGAEPSPDDALQFLRDLAVHPDTARHVARKLVVHFVSDTPDPGHVAQVAEAWGSKGDLMQVYAALLDHPAAWAPEFAKARQPYDFMIAMLRAFDTASLLSDPVKFGNRVANDLKQMGQPLQDPPGPNGWPEEASAWITPQGLAARVTTVRDYAQRFERTLDPRAFLETTLRDAAGKDLSFAVSAAEQKWEGLTLTLLSPEFNRR